MKDEDGRLMIEEWLADDHQAMKSFKTRSKRATADDVFGLDAVFVDTLQFAISSCREANFFGGPTGF